MNYPNTITTSETADGTYNSTEQSMLNHLKTDVTNLRFIVNEIITTLKLYGLA